MISHSHLTITLLVMAVDVLFCALVAGVAGLLARMDGASAAAALARGGTAFAGTLALSLALLTFLTTTLR